MGVINWVALGGVLVDLVIISIIASNAFWGHRRGLVGVMFKLLVFIVSIVLTLLLYKPASNAIINKTQLDEWLTEKIVVNIEGTSLANGNLLEYDEENTNISKGVINILNSFVTEALEKSVPDVLYYVAQNLSYCMIRIGTVLLLLIISRFFLLFIRFAAELIANLPIIRMFNRTGGLIFGLLKGFLTVYVILAIFSIISPIISDWGIINAIHDSTIGSKMYNNNFIINIVLNK